MKMKEMYYTPKAIIDLLQAKKQQAEYALVMVNPPFAKIHKKAAA